MPWNLSFFDADFLIMSGLPEFRLSLKSLFCLRDGEGTGKIPSFRLLRSFSKALRVLPQSWVTNAHYRTSAGSYPAARARLRTAAPLLLRRPGSGCACVDGWRRQVRCTAGTGWGRADLEQLPPPPQPLRPPQRSSEGPGVGDFPQGG